MTEGDIKQVSYDDNCHLPNPGIEPGSPALQADSLPTELWGKPVTTVVFVSRVLSGNSRMRQSPPLSWAPCCKGANSGFYRAKVDGVMKMCTWSLHPPSRANSGYLGPWSSLCKWPKVCFQALPDVGPCPSSPEQITAPGYTLLGLGVVQRWAVWSMLHLHTLLFPALRNTLVETIAKRLSLGCQCPTVPVSSRGGVAIVWGGGRDWGCDQQTSLVLVGTSEVCQCRQLATPACQCRSWWLAATERTVKDACEKVLGRRVGHWVVMFFPSWSCPLCHLQRATDNPRLLPKPAFPPILYFKGLSSSSSFSGIKVSQNWFP